MDYLCRDTQKMNVHYCSFNLDVLMKSVRVIDNQICYLEKNAIEVKKLFDSRYNMYRDGYNHRVTHSFECLMIDILMETDKVLYDYLETIWDVEAYLDLDNTIIHEIRISKDQKLEKARQLMDRFDSR